METVEQQLHRQNGGQTSLCSLRSPGSLFIIFCTLSPEGDASTSAQGRQLTTSKRIDKK
jgi:hypothetical protein